MNENINLLREKFPIVPQKSLEQAISDIYSGVDIDIRPRVSGWHNKKDYESLIREYSNVPTEIPTDVKRASNEIRGRSSISLVLLGESKWKPVIGSASQKPMDSKLCKTDMKILNGTVANNFGSGCEFYIFHDTDAKFSVVIRDT